MEIYAWCIVPSHVHLIFRAKNSNPSDLLRDFKTFTSKKIRKLIEDNPQESRKEWVLWMMERAGIKNSNVKGLTTINLSVYHKLKIMSLNL